MAQFLAFIWLGLTFSTPALATKSPCTESLIPKGYLENFEIFKEPRYLLSVGKVRWKSLIQRDDGLVFELILNANPDQQYLDSLTTKVDAFYKTEKQRIIIENIEIAPQFGFEYGHQLIIAHLLTRMPDLMQIEYDFSPDDLAPLRDRLSKGKPLEKAIKKMPISLAADRMGFEISDVTLQMGAELKEEALGSPNNMSVKVIYSRRQKPSNAP